LTARRDLLRLAAALGLAALAGAPAQADKDAQPKDASEVLLPRPAPLPPFGLIGHDGKPFGPERLRGNWTYVFFGFTNCPDICPTVLHHLVLVREELAKRNPAGALPTALFVSVDPKRDPPERLAEYTAAFDKDFFGATGDEAALRRFERIFGASHRLRPKRTAGEYDVVHSSEIYLVDPEGRHVATFWPPIEAEAWARLFLAIRDRPAPRR
jgi:protein SCO1/2